MVGVGRDDALEIRRRAAPRRAAVQGSPPQQFEVHHVVDDDFGVAVADLAPGTDDAGLGDEALGQGRGGPEEQVAVGRIPRQAQAMAGAVEDHEAQVVGVGHVPQGREGRRPGGGPGLPGGGIGPASAAGVLRDVPQHAGVEAADPVLVGNGLPTGPPGIRRERVAPRMGGVVGGGLAGGHPEDGVDIDGVRRPGDGGTESEEEGAHGGTLYCLYEYGHRNVEWGLRGPWIRAMAPA